jgi:hypothetical protein
VFFSREPRCGRVLSANVARMRVHLLGVAVLVTSGGACRDATHGAVTLGGLVPDSSPAVDEAESEVEAGVDEREGPPPYREPPRPVDCDHGPVPKGAIFVQETT